VVGYYISKVAYISSLRLAIDSSFGVISLEGISASAFSLGYSFSLGYDI
jgi:hypothetical protein